LQDDVRLEQSWKRSEVRPHENPEDHGGKWHLISLPQKVVSEKVSEVHYKGGKGYISTISANGGEADAPRRRFWYRLDGWTDGSFGTAVTDLNSTRI
jgi:hypothetical protein